MKLKKTLVMILAACLLIGTIASTAMAAESRPVLSLVGQDPGAPLAFDADGKPIAFTAPEKWNGWYGNGTGNYAYYVNGIQQWYWQYIDGEWYWFNPWTGYAVMRGTAWIDNRLYIFDSDGACVTTPGWYEIPNYFYVWAPNGSALRVAQTTTYFYLDKDGYINTGWNYIDGNWYMCDKYTGAMLSNTWYEDTTGYYYYFDEYARMVTGWWTDVNTGKTFYFNDLGVLQWGWLFLDGNWYYLDDFDAHRLEASAPNSPDGFYLIGPKDKAFWYYFDEDGVMQTGWQKIVEVAGSGDKINPVFDKDGNQIGVTIIEGNKVTIETWYYLTDWGAMVTGDVYMDGVTYHFLDTGEYVYADYTNREYLPEGQGYFINRDSSDSAFLVPEV